MVSSNTFYFTCLIRLYFFWNCTLSNDKFEDSSRILGNVRRISPLTSPPPPPPPPPPLSPREIKHIYLEGLDRNLMFVFTIKPNHRLNGVNSLPSRPAIKTINSCIDNPLHKQAFFFFFFTFEHGILKTWNVPSEFEESELDCHCLFIALLL